MTNTSVLTKNQTKQFVKCYTENGEQFRHEVTVRYDDQCGNGHNSFSITSDIREKAKNGRYVEYMGGCCHDEIVKHFPDLAPLIKWHLVSSDEPMHYIANSMYHAKEGKLDYARSCAVWPEAELADFTKEKLTARLPALQADFRDAVESLGFTF